jgi:hypothetical protein
MTKMTSKALNGSADAPTQSVTTEVRQRMIAEAAYYRALQRGFNGGDPVDDWLQSEREIDGALLSPAQQKRESAAHEAPERYALSTRPQSSRQRRHAQDTK